MLMQTPGVVLFLYICTGELKMKITVTTLHIGTDRPLQTM